MSSPKFVFENDKEMLVAFLCEISRGIEMVNGNQSRRSKGRLLESDRGICTRMMECL